MGWETSEEDIQVEAVEEILDTNPDLYKQRTIAALNEKRYEDALKDAQQALKYGYQELEYYVLLLRVLFEMGNYDICFKYLIISGLWEKREDKSLLSEEKNYLYYVYGVCFRKCGKRVEEAEFIVITPDGSGMYKTIQQAISYSDGRKTIFLTGGYYDEKTDIISKNIKLVCDENSRAIISKPMHILNSEVRIENLKFRMEESDCIMLEVKKSKCSFLNMILHGENKEDRRVGIYLENCNSVYLTGLKFEKLTTAFFTCSSNVNIIDSIFEKNKIGLLCASKETNKTLQGKVFGRNSQFLKNEIGVIAALNGYVKLEKSILDFNVDGVIAFSNRAVIMQLIQEKFEIGGLRLYPSSLTVYDGRSGQSGNIELVDSEIKHSGNVGISITDSSRADVVRCTVIGGKILGGLGYGVYAKDAGVCFIKDSVFENNIHAVYSTEQGKIEESNVYRLNNNISGVVIEGVKGIWNTIKNL